MIQPERLKQPEATITEIITISPPPEPPPTTPEPGRPRPPDIIIPGIWLPRGKKKYKEIADGYSAQYYVDATKQNPKPHWETINKKPLTKQSAVSLAARKVDETISARGRIVKLKNKVKPIDNRDNYFERNKYKFREFQQRKGVKTKTPNQIIELQKYRLDMAGERKKIKQERDLIRNSFGF